MRRNLLGLTVVLALAQTACERVPGVEQRTTNPKAKVEALFDIDGYRMYRFQDGDDGPTLYSRCRPRRSGWRK